MPESVKIGPFEYWVSSDAESHMAVENTEKSRLDGRSCPIELVIHVSPKGAEDYRRSTMIHEIVHQVFVIAGSMIDKDDEEKICRLLEAGLLGVIKENPDLVRWLTA